MLAWREDALDLRARWNAASRVSAPDRLLAASVFREEAGRERFARVGIARAATPERFERFRGWIAAGRHAGMQYLETTRELRGCPERLLPGARSIVCLAAGHSARPLVASDGATVARYASGADYHGTLRQRATRVARAAVRRLGAFRYRVCVDSTPLAERSLAAAAGLGWIGKNGCLIDPERGSFLLLAEILTDLDLPLDEPIAERCGSCVRCLEACPTGAFVEPGLLDASRCLAYWTIEHRGPIPDAMKERLGAHVFGCDVCQEVCPFNRREQPEGDARFVPRPLAGLGPAEVAALGASEFDRLAAGMALARARYDGLRRNALYAIGHARDRAARPVVARLTDDPAPSVSEAARWALDRLDGDSPSGT
jgi:epoxyqueuosine reductase